MVGQECRGGRPGCCVSWPPSVPPSTSVCMPKSESCLRSLRSIMLHEYVTTMDYASPWLSRGNDRMSLLRLSSGTQTSHGHSKANDVSTDPAPLFCPDPLNTLKKKWPPLTLVPPFLLTKQNRKSWTSEHTRKNT